MNKALSTLLCSCVLLLIACKPDPPKAAIDDLIGDWEVVKATRNQRPTGLLQGTYFAFSGNNAVRSNLPLYETPGEWESKFLIKDDSIVRFGNPPVDYVLKSWTDSTLSLAFTARGLPFALQLRRAKGPVGVIVKDSLE